MRPSRELLKKPHVAQVAVALAQRIIAQAGAELPDEPERRCIERAALIIGIKSRLDAGAAFPAEEAMGALKGLQEVYKKIVAESNLQDIPFNEPRH